MGHGQAHASATASVTASAPTNAEVEPGVADPSAVDKFLSQRTASRDGTTGSGRTPYAHVNRGYVCKGRNDADCFLDTDGRAAFFGIFTDRCDVVQENYKHALERVRVSKLLEKDEGLSWFGSLVLDIASTFLIGQIVSGALRIRQNAAGALSRLAEEAALAQDAEHWSFDAEAKLRRVTPQRLTTGVTSLLGAAKAPVKAEIEKRVGKTQHAKREAAKHFINVLHMAADKGFQELREQTPGFATDADLLVLIESLDALHHGVDQYEAMLTAKITRFETSGVSAIGREVADTKPVGAYDVPVYERPRDTRVVWHEYVSGHPKELFFEYQDASQMPGPIGYGMFDPLREPEKLPMKFGPRVPMTSAPQTGHVVPHEFVEYALSAHQQAWGTSPATILVDDTTWSDPEHVVYAHLNRKVPRNASAGDIVKQAMDAQLRQPQGTSASGPDPHATMPVTGLSGPSATEVWMGRNPGP